MSLGYPRRQCGKCKMLRAAEVAICPGCGLKRSKLIPDPALAFGDWRDRHDWDALYLSATETNRDHLDGYWARRDIVPAVRISGARDEYDSEVCRWFHDRAWRLDDPSWWLYAPPHAKGCRCGVVPVTESHLPRVVLESGPPPFPPQGFAGWHPSANPALDAQVAAERAGIQAWVDRAAAAPAEPVRRAGCLLGLLSFMLRNHG